MKQAVLDLQNRLRSLGYDPGPLDGDVGPKTYAALLSATAGRQLGSLGVLKGRAYAHLFPIHQVVTPRRISHFIAQCAHETGGYRFFVEKGSGDGPDPDPWDDYLQRYDFRKDLGNSKGGDGARYRGRGDIQITGYINYARYGKRIGVDLINQPQRAAEPEIAAEIACLYWSDRNLNTYADVDDIRTITRKINGGYNGLADRERYYQRGRELWGY